MRYIFILAIVVCSLLYITQIAADGETRGWDPCEFSHFDPSCVIIMLGQVPIEEQNPDNEIYIGADWNPSPSNSYAKTVTKKSAFCIHRMDGEAEYLRNFEHLAEGRKISAHFTIDSDGLIEQHVRTSHTSFTQGIPPQRYHLVNWPLFNNRNPNYDCISVELEDHYRDWSDERPMPLVQLRALQRLTRWLFTSGVIDGVPEIGVTIIGHSHIDPVRKPYDPGDYFWENYGIYLVPQIYFPLWP